MDKTTKASSRQCSIFYVGVGEQIHQDDVILVRGHDSCGLWLTRFLKPRVRRPGERNLRAALEIQGRGGTVEIRNYIVGQSAANS